MGGIQLPQKKKMGGPGRVNRFNLVLVFTGTRESLALKQEVVFSS